MVIDEIILHNVGLFRGVQRALLAPPSERQPVTLFGGLNGAGKTTLLEAMQLALFGKQATTSRREGLSYEDYLRRMIHRRVNPRDGASVELRVSMLERGQPQHLRIRRTWRAPSTKVTESLEIFREDALDPHLSDGWEEHVARLLPPQLAGLFFFDGERIEALADPERSADVLTAAINALLGVDLVVQAKADLGVLDRRKLTELSPEPERRHIEELQRQIAELDKSIQDAFQAEAGLRSELEQLNTWLVRKESEFTHEGGQLAEARQTLEAKRKSLGDRIEHSKQALISLSATSLPLIMARQQLDRMVMQARREADSERAELLLAAIVERDARILDELTNLDLGVRVVAKIKGVLHRDQAQRQAVESETRYLGLPRDGRIRLENLCAHELIREESEARRVLADLDALETEADNLDRRLAAVPDAEAVVRLISEREEMRKKHGGVEAKLAMALEQTERLQRQKADLEQKVEKLVEQERAAQWANEDLSRFLKHSRRVQDTLERFRTAVTQRHTQQLETLILEGFGQLLRKRSLVYNVRIDPLTCKLALLDVAGNTLPPERLSAGERQLLAVAILWGLARASGRPLPVVIDTPLGRLDAGHRTHLVQRYFPCASHQVILLSTDEEIDERYLKMLKPSVGRCYRLVYDEDTDGTTIQPGYFWEEAKIC